MSDERVSPAPGEAPRREERVQDRPSVPPAEPASAERRGPSFRARLVRWSWLRRVFEVRTPLGPFEVDYSGRGAGFETVFVNGEVAKRDTGWAWFVPRFDFHVGPYPAVVEVRVWPW